MLKRNLTNPSVSRIFQGDGEPRMIFVFRVTRIESGFKPQIFYADILDAARPRISFYKSAAKVCFNRGRDRRINSYLITINLLDNAIPNQIVTARVPDQPPVAEAATKFRHAERINPFLCAGTNHVNRVAHFQTARVLQMKTGRTDGNVGVRNLPVWIGVTGKIILATNANERAPVNSGCD